MFFRDVEPVGFIKMIFILFIYVIDNDWFMVNGDKLLFIVLYLLYIMMFIISDWLT